MAIKTDSNFLFFLHVWLLFNSLRIVAALSRRTRDLFPQVSDFTPFLFL